MTPPIIDFRFTCPISLGLDRYLKPKGPTADFAAHYGKSVYGEDSDLHYMTPDELVAWMDEQSVDKVVIKSADNTTTTGSKFPGEDLHAFIKDYPDRLIGIAGADPHKGTDAVRELERDVKEFGFRGVNLTPFEQDLFANDKKYYPIYAKCVELDIPVLLHTSTNLTRTKLAEYGRPIYLDGVAKDFPELRIVAVHGGWPWILEMIAVALKQPNIYIEISGTHPRYIGMPGTGWEPLLVYGNSLLKHKILWGSNWPMIGPKESLEEFRKFPLKEEVKDLWFGGNALRALKLDK